MRRLAPTARMAGLLVGLVAAVALPSPAQAEGPQPTVPPRIIGVATPGAPAELDGLTAITQALGEAPDQVTFYSSWAVVRDFPTQGAREIAATGAVPQVTWEPWNPLLGPEQPTYSLDKITAGLHDSYLKRWARQVKAYGDPVVIRFAHEMNGNWYPWSEGVNGNEPGDFRTMWRHVVGVFRGLKVRNVTWAWSPNVPYPGSVPLAGLYPGDRWVTRVGLDGYNFSTLYDWSTWQSFEQVFGPGLAEVDALSTRPLYISETATPEVGGDKAAWIRDMWSFLAAHPEVRGLTWFDFVKETDWRIDSSAESLTAFRDGMSTFR